MPEVDVALRVMVEQAAGRGDDDVDAARKARLLAAEADAAEQRHRRQRQVAAVGADGGLDLSGEFTRRRDDQRARTALAAL